MWYAVISEDHSDSLKNRIEARHEHRARLESLRDEGRLLLAGPHPAIDSPDPGAAGFTGSLVIVDFPRLEDAIAWADADPYVSGGVYKNVTVKPFSPLLP